MKLKLQHCVFFIIAVIPIISGCKREVPNQVPNVSMGITYSLPGNQIPYGSIKAEDGGYLIYGFIDNFSGSRDGFLMKLDQNQQLVWQKTIGGTRLDEFRSACYDKEGNILATGISLSNNLDSSLIGDFPTMFTVYLTGSGEIIWKNFFSAPYRKSNISTSANKVLYLPNGNFVLVGTTKNYDNTWVGNSYRAFLLYVNKGGDTLGSSSFDVSDEIAYSNDSSKITYLHSFGQNAILTKEGNILLLLIKRENVIKISKSNIMINWRNEYFEGGSTFIKLDPENSYGYNKFIWRKTLANLNIYRTDESDSYFFPIQLVRTTDKEEVYCLVHPNTSKIGTPTPLTFINETGELLSNPVSSVPLKLANASTSIHTKNGFIWVVDNRTITKLNNQGVVFWSKTLNNINYLSGIYEQDNETMVVFGAHMNSNSELDIICLKLNSNGELIKSN